MSPKGKITRALNRRLQWMLGAQVLWLGMVFLLGAWWVSLVLRQASRIEELEKLAGLASAQGNWARTQRMVHWESGTFFALLLASTALLFWLYWRDSMRTRGLQAFFASVTHELRTPLTSIRLQAESIADNLSGKPSESALIQRLLEDTLRLESQVERTLELARVEGGGPVFTQPMRIRPWADRTLKAWCDTHGTRLLVKNELDDVAVQADPTAVQVILKNLLENSIRHSKKEQVIVRLASEIRDGKVALCFSDDGVGFDGNASTLGDIFQKGQSSQGAGVGLYLVRTLMEKMGGKADFNAGHGFEASLLFKEAQTDA